MAFMRIPGSFRDDVGLERYGVTPTLSYRPTDRTQVKLGYEYFHDDRTVDRGIPSFERTTFRRASIDFLREPPRQQRVCGRQCGDA